MTEAHDMGPDLAAGYVLGALSPAEREAFERHLAAGCPECETAVRESSQGAVAFARSALPVAPSPALKGRVMEALRAPASSPAALSSPGAEGRKVIEMPRRATAGAGSWLWSAAAAALAVTTALSWINAARLQREVDAGRRVLSNLQSQLEVERRWAAVLGAPGAKVVSLALTPQGVAALRARATYDPSTRNAVVVFENFRAPEGKDYQLWALQGAGVASLGVIRADQNGEAVLRLENAGDPITLLGFAVSLEPAGGSPDPEKPTGPVVMAGTFGG